MASGSSPKTLDTAQTTAIGAVGIPTLDLEALSLGTPATAGVCAAHVMSVGSSVAGVHQRFIHRPHSRMVDVA
jgi:hypothetical protein